MDATCAVDAALAAGADVSRTVADLLAAFQGELAVYHDDHKDYSSNEPTMDGTASAILMFALCSGASD